MCLRHPLLDLHNRVHPPRPRRRCLRAIPRLHPCTITTHHRTVITLTDHLLLFDFFGLLGLFGHRRTSRSSRLSYLISLFIYSSLPLMFSSFPIKDLPLSTYLVSI